MAVHNVTNPTSILFQLAWKIFSFSYGVFTLGVFVFLAYVRKSAFRKLSEQGKKELAIGNVQPYCSSRRGHLN